MSLCCHMTYKVFSFFFSIKYVEDNYFFFPRFLETKTDTLLAVTPTTICKSLSCKDRAMKRILLHSITAGFALNWIRTRQHVLSSQPRTEEHLSLPQQLENRTSVYAFRTRESVLFSRPTSLTLSSQLFFFP